MAMRVEVKTSRYYWREGARMSHAAAQECGAVLEELGAAPGAELSTTAQKDALIDRARPETSAMHKHFTWDDAAAGIKCRREEARHLIRNLCVEVVVNDQHFRSQRYVESVRVPVRVDNAPPAPPQWLTVEAVAQRPDAMETVLQDALKGLLSWEERFGTLIALYDSLGHEIDPRMLEIARLVTIIRRDRAA